MPGPFTKRVTVKVRKVKYVFKYLSNTLQIKHGMALFNLEWPKIVNANCLLFCADILLESYMGVSRN